MTDQPESTETLQGVPAPNPETVPQIDDGLSDAERRLQQRAVEAAKKDTKVWRFRGEVYRLRHVMPATVLASIGDVQSTKNVGKIIDAITDLFVAEDGPKVRDALLDTSVEYPVDMDFVNDTFTELIQEISGRGLVKPQR